LKMDGQLSFDNEIDYDVVNIFFYEYRLLSLFRCWNVIYNFFPYKYLMDQPWDKTLDEFIPHFLKASDYEKYCEAMLKLITKINDGHAYAKFMPQGNLSINTTAMVDTLTVIRTPPENSLLKRGDIILSINGEAIDSVRDSLATIIPYSNRHFTNLMINAWINKTIIDGCVLTVSRDEEEWTINEEIKSSLSQKDTLPFYHISPDIGYVDLGLLKMSDITGMIDSLESTSGVIFDLRNYPENLNFYEFFRHLLSPQKFYFFAQANIADLSHSGAFYEMVKNRMFYTEEEMQECKQYKGEMIVLINAITMSMAETLAMIFKSSNAVLIGTPTAGSNGDVAILKLPGGTFTSFSSIGFSYPYGEETQRKGIIPDIEIYPTMDDIMAGRDEVLEAAITYLNSN